MSTTSQYVIELTKRTIGEREPTARELRKLCDAIPSSAFMVDTGMGFKTYASDSSAVIQALKKAWPQFPWRIIECHDRERTYGAISWKNPDPREYEEMRKRGRWEDGTFVPNRRKVRA